MCAEEEAGDVRAHDHEKSKPQFDTQNENLDLDFVPVHYVRVVVLLIN